MNNRLIDEKESLIEYIDILIGIYTVKASNNNKLMDIVNELEMLRKSIIKISNYDEVAMYKKRILYLENIIGDGNNGR